MVELQVEAPLIAKARRAGHFVIVRADEKSERIPLTIADADVEKGIITLVIQRIGASTHKICALKEGDMLHDVVGPLGKSTDIKYFGTVVCACGGVGAAPMLPIARALREAGNKVITVLAARTKELIILEEQLRSCSDEVIVMTDDGSYGTKGLVTNGVESVIQREKVDKCVTIGPAIMMKFVALLTKKYSVPTEASLNTIMVDGTGMCGACRVTIGGKTRFVCVDGPEFDAHEVDFDEMLRRLGGYRTEEQSAMARYVSACAAGEVASPNLAQYAEETKEAISVDDIDKGTEHSYASEVSGALTAKERASLHRVVMPQLDPQYRATSLYEEVNLGLTADMARYEAQRCLHCKTPGCVQGCPVGIDIPAFIGQIEKGEFIAAADTIKGLLPVLDDCERAMQMLESSSDESAKQGTTLIYDKLIAYLKSRGLEPILAKGEKFDVDYHEAVTQFPAPSDELKGKVIDVIQTGYLLNGKVIRYAKVVVGV